MVDSKKMPIKVKRQIMRDTFYRYKLAILFIERKRFGYYDICENIDSKEEIEHINFKNNIDVILSVLDKDSRDIISKEYILGESVDCFTFNWSKSVFYRKKLHAINQLEMAE